MSGLQAIFQTRRRRAAVNVDGGGGASVGGAGWGGGAVDGAAPAGAGVPRWRWPTLCRRSKTTHRNISLLVLFGLVALTYWTTISSGVVVESFGEENDGGSHGKKTKLLAKNDGDGHENKAKTENGPRGSPDAETNRSKIFDDGRGKLFLHKDGIGGTDKNVVDQSIVRVNETRRSNEVDSVTEVERRGATLYATGIEVEHKTGPPLFDHSHGWKGTSYEEAIRFCKNNADSRSICPWKAYCPRSRLNPRIQPSENEMELWAPMASQDQPVWVSVGSKYPCMQTGQLDDSAKSRSRMKYIMCCHEGEEDLEFENVPNLTSVNQTDLIVENERCMKRCHELNNETESSSIIPSSQQRYCLAQCRWMYRQKAISRLASTNSLAQNAVANVTDAKSPLLQDGSCSDLSKTLHYDGVCKSVAHRQKPRVDLVLSDKAWLGKERDLGLRDCAASRCDVSMGAGHSNSSHLFVGTLQADEERTFSTHARGLGPHRQDEFQLRLSRGPRSHPSPACDLCDRYAEEVLPDAERPWDQSLGLSTLDPCVARLLSRHTLPGTLPLVDPAYGFDAVFVTNYTPLRQRREVVRERVRQTLGLEPVFVNDFDRENLTDGDVMCFGHREAQMAAMGRVASMGAYSLTIKVCFSYYKQ